LQNGLSCFSFPPWWFSLPAAATVKMKLNLAETIAPIMETHCNSCHSGANPSAGIVTADYEGLREVAMDGSLVGAVNHDPDYSAMPQGQPQLDECPREQIAAWVDDGAQDN